MLRDVHERMVSPGDRAVSTDLMKGFIGDFNTPGILLMTAWNSFSIICNLPPLKMVNKSYWYKYSFHILIQSNHVGLFVEFIYNFSAIAWLAVYYQHTLIIITFSSTEVTIQAAVFYTITKWQLLYDLCYANIDLILHVWVGTAIGIVLARDLRSHSLWLIFRH